MLYKHSQNSPQSTYLLQSMFLALVLANIVWKTHDSTLYLKWVTDVAICEMKKLCNDTQNVLTENYFISTL